MVTRLVGYYSNFIDVSVYLSQSKKKFLCLRVRTPIPCYPACQGNVHAR